MLRTRKGAQAGGTREAAGRNEGLTEPARTAPSRIEILLKEPPAMMLDYQMQFFFSLQYTSRQDFVLIVAK
jgi:hypothetical protein